MPIAASPLQEFTKQVVTKLFEHEHRRIGEKRDDIIRQAAMLGYGHGFFYQGQWYTQLDPRRADRLPKKSPPDSLLGPLSALGTDKSRITFDSERVQQAISLVLLPCVQKLGISAQDARDALPDCLVDYSGLRSFERTRVEAFTILDDSRAHRQYMKIRPVILYYSTTSLIY